MIFMRANPFRETMERVGPENPGFVGANGTLFDCCQIAMSISKSIVFQGPPLSIYPRNGFAIIKVN
jgi:hypothetical protein